MQWSVIIFIKRIIIWSSIFSAEQPALAQLLFLILKKEYMANKLTAKMEATINAPVSKVWRAFTDPAMIKQYMFGTDTVTDWKKGSIISYSGVWNGKEYHDKGTIVDIVPEQRLHTTFFSSMSGKEDKPENYANVIYEVRPGGGNSIVTITQDNIATEAELEHMKQNWGVVLEGMKKLLEK